MLIVIAATLVVLAAIFSGLNLGLMSLDTFELRRKAELGDKDARKVYRVRVRGNLLLVTLLTGNVAAISALSIVLDSVYHGVVAGLLTTVLITVFGEIVPQAIVARYALRIGAQFTGLVRLLMIVLYPVCAPIAWALDRILGDELPTVYSKPELARIIEEHRDHHESGLDQDEVRIATGALNFGDRLIREVMTPRSVARMLPAEALIDAKFIKELKQAGFSRLPAYRASQDNIIGILYAKDLIGLKLGAKTVAEIARPSVRFVNENDHLDDTLNAFLKSRSHLSVVINEFSEVLGIVTIEDVLEEIIDREIRDEFDQHEDMRQVARKLKRPQPSGQGRSS
ncbi:MAG TPA: hemolysin family protein [Candidatus Saccharimonadia bacterium]|nr:hemolysin family protein [Candidatus Saccharimonadia bacterium]